MLGQAVVRQAGLRGIAVRSVHRTEFDLLTPGGRAELAAAVTAAAPPWVINCAAYTAVDKAETEPDAAEALNHWAPAALAQGLEQAGCATRVLHVSTDYVFDGTAAEPYREDAAVAPANVYGATKQRGEAALMAASSRHVIARTSWLFGSGGKNFVETMLTVAGAGRALRVIDDQRGLPTYTNHLAELLLAMAGRGGQGAQPLPGGVYHTVGGGAPTTWFGLAAEAFRCAGLVPGGGFSPCSTEDYPTPARRPANSCLADTRLRATGLAPLPPWPEGVAAYVAERERATGAARSQP